MKLNDWFNNSARYHVEIETKFFSYLTFHPFKLLMKIRPQNTRCSCDVIFFLSSGQVRVEEKRILKYQP